MWAIILACHAATTSFTGLMVARFFLGCTEASLSPGFTLITSLWYRTSEQPLRHGIWFCGNSLSLIFGNLIAVGILQIQNSLKAWQVIFVSLSFDVSKRSLTWLHSGYLSYLES
jgi:ACS family allantoate permease-like MFS transporter